MGGNSSKNEEIFNQINNKEKINLPNNYKNFESLLKEKKIVIKEIGSKGFNPLQFNYPNSIFFDEKNEKILISDSGNHRIQILNSKNFEFIQFIENNGKGSNENQFNYPQGINLNKNNNQIFICDSGNQRIKIYENFNENEEIKFLNLINFYFNKKKEKINFNWPNKLEFNYENDQILVSNWSNHEILIFNSSFNFISKIKEKNKFNQYNELKCPNQIKFNSQNNLIISDSENISFFDENFEFLFSFDQNFL